MAHPQKLKLSEEEIGASAPQAAPSVRMHSVEEAGRMLGLKRSITWEEIRFGRLKSVRVGRRRLVPTEYIEQYVELLKREADSDLAA
ncbi:excisionase family DNA-binding protein [Streptomyces sp. WMMB303]|uniref:excisionase family DNA-binding protein n=1 Tax=Streptomyces sp. WMMB303 TaxID=3034154 RepID=UPI0023EE03E1|nr:excisionase family DNA-binding protein [Streptomyces sp. WMMB303]MDF4250474.1 excisionase family DNA-binding protein [Streptomyces sp. WMMB303]